MNLYSIFNVQSERLKELLKKVKDALADKDNKTAEEIKSSTSELQQASLKLFEMAYKKVSYWLYTVVQKVKV